MSQLKEDQAARIEELKKLKVELKEAQQKAIEMEKTQQAVFDKHEELEKELADARAKWAEEKEMLNSQEVYDQISNTAIEEFKKSKEYMEEFTLKYSNTMSRAVTMS